ncbi:MAG: (2Fe-2S) ferredoxin domain-containing protein [Methylorubrum populi]
MGRRQDPGGAPRTAKAGFSDLVLVCGKCAKRQGVARKRLGRALKRALETDSGGKGQAKDKAKGKVRVLETGCLGPCPKRMLTLATPQSLARRRVLLVDPALDALGPGALGLDRTPSPLSGPAAVADLPAGLPPDGGRDG